MITPGSSRLDAPSCSMKVSSTTGCISRANAPAASASMTMPARATSSRPRYGCENPTSRR